MPFPLGPLVAAGIRAATSRVAGRTAAGAVAGSAAASAVTGGDKRDAAPPQRTRNGLKTRTMAEPDEAHDRTNKLFGAQIGWDLFDRAMSKVGRNVPTFTHSITVSVQGGPVADLRRTYYLALAAAFGRWSKGISGELRGSSKSLIAHIDVTGKSATINISYTTLQGITALRSFFGFKDTPTRIIQEGPDQITVGGSWLSFLQSTTTVATGGPNSVNIVGGNGLIDTSKVGVVGGGLGRLDNATEAGSTRVGVGSLQYRPNPAIPGCNTFGFVPIILVGDGQRPSVYAELPYSDAAEIKRIPFGQTTVAGGVSTALVVQNGVNVPTILPDTNRVITTGQKLHPLVQPPKPPLDGISRGSLAALVSQALNSPCYLPAPVPCNPRNPLASGGLYASLAVRVIDVGGVKELVPAGIDAATTAANGLVPVSDVGIDGYTELDGDVPRVNR